MVLSPMRHAGAQATAPYTGACKRKPADGTTLLGSPRGGVHIDGTGFWKATANVEHKVQPFVVYETVNGVKKVYKKAATNNFFRLSLGKRKVG